MDKVCNVLTVLDPRLVLFGGETLLFAFGSRLFKLRTPHLVSS